METIMFMIMGIVVLLGVCNIVLHLRRNPMTEELSQGLEGISSQMGQSMQSLKEDLTQNRLETGRTAKDLRMELGQSLGSFGERQMQVFKVVNAQVSQLMDSNEKRFERLQHTTVESLDKIRHEVDKRLHAIQSDNQVHMEKMRSTVEDKLHKTLEDRLGHSFRLVSDHLEKVQKGLGEMQNLAAGVGDLKKVLANVKTRGILGEFQLLSIIEEIMTLDQYSLNINLVPGRDSRVEVAIKLPGKQADDTYLYLPIDSKFPMDRYQRLIEAYDLANQDEILVQTKELQRALVTAAKDIRRKYVSPPYTTDFAIMFLPVEGLYAEVCRQPGLVHRLKSEYQVLVVGPNNLSAFLSSLQMGFRTLAIERRSSEVWTLLSEIKTEFGKFGTALEKVQKKLSEANNVIDQAGVRRRAIERRLNKVEELPAPEQLTLDKVM